MLRAKGKGKIWLELHVAQGSAKLAGEGCTLDLPRSLASRPPGASITINHRHMYSNAHDGTGSSGEKGGAASRHGGRASADTPFVPSFNSACMRACLPTVLACLPACLLSASRCTTVCSSRHPLVDPFAVLTTTAVTLTS